jgi:hypothetical protein
MKTSGSAYATPDYSFDNDLIIAIFTSQSPDFISSINPHL